MKLLRLLYLLCIISISTTAFGQIEYTLRLEPDGETYCAYMRSNQTITGNQALIATAQFTILVPHATGSDRFELIKPSDNSPGVDNFQPNMNWSPSTRVDAPTENPGFDYISFGFINNVLNPSDQALFDIIAGVEYQLFCFKNAGTCLGELFIIENGVDPFIPPNSQNTNPENSITIGAVGSAYSNNYNSGNKDCSTCDINDPSADCDNDGTPNGTDCDPSNPSVQTSDACGVCGGDGSTCLPEAVDDIATVSEDTPTNLDPVSNDDFGTDGPSTGTITIVNVTNGTATVNDGGTPNDPSDDTIDFTPDADYVGPATVVYEICDATGDCDQGIISVTVTACDLNDPSADCDNDGTPNGTDCDPSNPSVQVLDDCGVCGGDGSSCACDADAPEISNVRNE